LIRNEHDAQHASKVLVDHALARFSTDNLSCMVIRLDSNRVKDVVNNKADQIGVVGDNNKASEGISEADKIVEGARKNIAASGLADNPEAAEKATQDTLHKMANHSRQQEPGPEMSINQNNDLPSVDILSPNKIPDNPPGTTK
jgi:protein phosphatase PTC1